MKKKDKPKPRLDLIESSTMQSFSLMLRDDIMRLYEEQGISVVCGLVITQAVARVAATAADQDTLDHLKPLIERYIKQKYNINLIFS